MKALVTGFHMPYRLSPDSKYPWSGENTGPIEIPVLNIPLLGSGLVFVRGTGCSRNWQNCKSGAIKGRTLHTGVTV